MEPAANYYVFTYHSNCSLGHYDGSAVIGGPNVKWGLSSFVGPFPTREAAKAWGDLLEVMEHSVHGDNVEYIYRYEVTRAQHPSKAIGSHLLDLMSGHGVSWNDLRDGAKESWDDEPGGFARIWGPMEDFLKIYDLEGMEDRLEEHVAWIESIYERARSIKEKRQAESNG